MLGFAIHTPPTAISHIEERVIEDGEFDTPPFSTLFVSQTSISSITVQRMCMDAKAELDLYESFEKGWDGYGAEPFEIVAIAKARGIVSMVNRYLLEAGVSLDEITPGPVSDGSIDIEVRIGEKLVILSLDKTGSPLRYIEKIQVLVKNSLSLLVGLVWKKSCIGFFARSWAKLKWVNLGDVPDDQYLYRSVYNAFQMKSNGELKSSFFKSADLSCDIAILTTKEKARLGNPPKFPVTAGLVQFNVRSVRELSGDGVYHDPLTKENFGPNYAHAQFRNKMTTGQARAMKEKVQVCIRPTDLR